MCLSLLLGAQYKQHLYSIEIFRAQNHRIIKVGRDLWDHQVQQCLVSVLLSGSIILSIFLQRNCVGLKCYTQSCCFIYSTSKADLYPLWKKIRCPAYPGSAQWFKEPVLPLVTSRRDRNYQQMFPKRGFHECGLGPSCLFFHWIIGFLVVKGAEPHLWPISVWISDSVAVGKGSAAIQS